MSTPSASVSQPASFAFTPENLEKARALMAKYPPHGLGSAVIPLLHLAQRQHDGWLPRAAMDCVATMTKVPRIQVYEVATFYTMFNLAPVGRHHVQVCTNLSCWLRGSDRIVDACRETLGIDLGETSADRMFTLSEVECLCACVNAPLMQIGDDFYEDLDPASAKAILEALRRGETPKPGPQNGRRGCEPAGGLTTLAGKD